MLEMNLKIMLCLGDDTVASFTVFGSGVVFVEEFNGMGIQRHGSILLDKEEVRRIFSEIVESFVQ